MNLHCSVRRKSDNGNEEYSGENEADYNAAVCASTFSVCVVRIQKALVSNSSASSLASVVVATVVLTPV